MGPRAAGLVVVGTTAPSKAERNSRVTVLVSALPAFLLPPETGRTRGPGAEGHLGSTRALGIAPHAISEALVTLPARRKSTHGREMRIKPLSHVEGRPQETLIYLLAELRL